MKGNDEKDYSEEKCNDEKDVEKVEELLHLIEMKLPKDGHDKGIKLKLPCIERVQIIDENVIVVSNDSSGKILIQGLNLYDVNIIDRSEVETQYDRETYDK